MRRIVSFSKHQPSGPMLSISRFIHMCVCGLSVCSLLRYSLNVFLHPLPKVGCLIFFRDLEFLEKVMERSGIRKKITNKGGKIAAQKKIVFFLW